MAVVAGIDEAGFGPMLGPLVVSGVAIEVPDDAIDRCLWKALGRSCTSHRRRGDRRLLIADSKVVYRPRGDFSPLERSVLVTLRAWGRGPRSWRELVRLLAPETLPSLDGCPWYAGRDLALPVSPMVGDLGTQANAFRRDAEESGVRMRGVYCEPLTAGTFNRLVRNTRNKSVVLLGLVWRVIDRILRDAPGQRVRIYVDRLGGRTHYADALRTAWQPRVLDVLEETPQRSTYRLTIPKQSWEVSFVTDGDARHFPVALASLYSKYLRELSMRVMNAYWGERVPGLRPTAGYVTDARRWLRDVEPWLARFSIPRDLLVRLR